MECQLPLDLPQKLNCPCCESFPANAFHSRVSQKAQSGEFKYRGGSSLPWNLLNAIKRGLGHRIPWGCFSLGFSNSWIGHSTRVGLKFSPNSQFPYCLELVLLVRASSLKYKEQYIDHNLFVPLILTNVLPNWAGARHLCQMSTSTTNVTSWELSVIVTVQCSNLENSRIFDT